MALLTMAGCHMWGVGKKAAADPAELIVTGAPAGALIFVDGAQVGPAAARNDESEIITVAPGSHLVEIHLDDAIVYREDTYAGHGDHRVVTVLSGSSH